jgi:hypothetical protein
LKSKKLVAALAAVLTLFALTGCSLSREVASLDPYAPSDGVQLDLPEIKARNVLFVSDGKGNAVLIGSFINATQEKQSAQIETMDAEGNLIVTEFSIEPAGKFDLGYNGTEGKELTLMEIPGSMHSVYLRVTGDPAQMLVPILDGTLEEYRPFID